jgi:signal transduction histidine kinase
VVLDVPADDVVLADQAQMLRVLTNLLDNAVRFSPRGGTVVLRASPGEEPDRVELAVSDEGPGIGIADTDRIFERFYRGDPARSGSGKGLGLAIARHIVEGHGGRIWVDRTVRRGATIRLTLPIAD